MDSFDESIYEKLGEGLAYQVFWSDFGEAPLLSLLSRHGCAAEHPEQSRALLCYAFSQTLRVLRAETQFPFQPDMPPDAAKIAGAAFHKTFRHLEEEFWRKAAVLSPELVPAK
ncbi:hypothetical protein [Massilia sp. CT11-137]|uniref:hypothetical protein n=1 Tax=Massilia sp. CT11-137 TaxID=3393901 RepID=UPI0039AF3343